MQTNPIYYGLSYRTQLEMLDEQNIAIRKVVKSRIIQKNAAKIVELASRIKSVTPEVTVTLICTRNICSKSLALLANEGIIVQYVN